jgi:hypothetical protein
MHMKEMTATMPDINKPSTRGGMPGSVYRVASITLAEKNGGLYRAATAEWSKRGLLVACKVRLYGPNGLHSNGWTYFGETKGSGYNRTTASFIDAVVWEGKVVLSQSIDGADAKGIEAALCAMLRAIGHEVFPDDPSKYLFVDDELGY